MKRKDALTDLVENVQGTTQTQTPLQPSGDREVVNQAGETITLGQGEAKNTALSNKGNVIELYKIQEVVTRALEKAFDKALARLRNRK